MSCRLPWHRRLPRHLVQVKDFFFLPPRVVKICSLLRITYSLLTAVGVGGGGGGVMVYAALPSVKCRALLCLSVDSCWELRFII